MEVWVLYFYIIWYDREEAGQYLTEQRCHVGYMMQRDYFRMRYGPAMRWDCVKEQR